LFYPFKSALDQVPVLVARGNRPLLATFEDQLKIVTYYHPEEHSSGRHLLQVLAHIPATLRNKLNGVARYQGRLTD